VEGIIIVNKPQDWTSFDVVAKIRNLSKVKKVGHSGTLDPMATGVLPIFLGRATKSIQYFMEGNKGYLAEMTLGVRTDTGDAYGRKSEILNLPAGKAGPKSETNSNIEIPNRKQILEVLEKYKGEIDQIPPMYSAKKVNGQRLYKLARKGIEIKREPRKVAIHSLKLLKVEGSLVSFEVICSKGTYIRQLVVDIGDDLGCGAHLSKLVRTYAHPFRISQAINMDTIITLAKHGQLENVIISVESVLNGQAEKT